MHGFRFRFRCLSYLSQKTSYRLLDLCCRLLAGRTRGGGGGGGRVGGGGGPSMTSVIGRGKRKGDDILVFAPHK
jgi:hypothetical protein